MGVFSRGTNGVNHHFPLQPGQRLTQPLFRRGLKPLELRDGNASSAHLMRLHDDKFSAVRYEQGETINPSPRNSVIRTSVPMSQEYVPLSNKLASINVECSVAMTAAPWLP